MIRIKAKFKYKTNKDIVSNNENISNIPITVARHSYRSRLAGIL